MSSHRQCSLEDGGFSTLVPEAFNAWFPVSVKSLKVTFAARVFGLRPNKCRPVVDETTRETHARKISSTQGRDLGSSIRSVKNVLDIFHTSFVCVFDGVPRARSRLGSWGRVTGNLLDN